MTSIILTDRLKNPIKLNITTLPKISVYITVKNMGNSIEKTIKSIVDQDYPNLELIIHDGGSTDDTLAVIQRYKHHIDILDTSPDHGPDYNTALALFTGDLLAFLNADDWYEPGILKQVGDLYQKNSEVDMITCYGRVVTVSPDDKLDKVILQYTSPNVLELTKKNIFYSISAIGCRFFTKEIVKKVGQFYQYDENNQPIITNDKEWLFRLLKLNPKNLNIARIGHNYRAHSASLSFSHNLKSKLISTSHNEKLADYMMAQAYLSDPKDRKFIYHWKCAMTLAKVNYLMQIGRTQEGFKVFWHAFLEYGFITIASAARMAYNKLRNILRRL